MWRNTKYYQKTFEISDDEISNTVDEFLNYINTKRDEYKIEIENGEKDYRMINRNELDWFRDKKTWRIWIK